MSFVFFTFSSSSTPAKMGWEVKVGQLLVVARRRASGGLLSLIMEVKKLCVITGV